MNPREKAHTDLKGYWAPTLVVQSIWLCGSLLILLLELLLLAIAGADQAAAVFSPVQPPSWPHILVLAGMLLLDLFFLSPLHLGRVRYFVGIFQDEVRVRELFAFYSPKKYGTAVWWRARLWLRYAAWGTLFCLPGTLALSGGVLIRRGIMADPTGILVLCLNLIGVLFLLSGGIAFGLWTRRYEPAALLLATGAPSQGVFRRARRAMKGRIGQLTWLYLRLAGWKISELLLLPGFYAGPLIAAARLRFLQRVLRKEPAVTALSPSSFFRRLSRTTAVS
ncbi:MAG: hypothetical protein HFJ80_04610 [Clostridiales bacterium]|nr:hypothetical protein [Clostridiales bacterium]